MLSRPFLNSPMSIAQALVVLAAAPAAGFAYAIVLAVLP